MAVMTLAAEELYRSCSRDGSVRCYVQQRVVAWIYSSRARSRALHEIYDSLSQEQLEQIVDQIIDILEQLHRHSWEGVSELVFFPASPRVVPGRILEETHWLAQDMAKHFLSESVETFNIHGPYDSYTAYITALTPNYQRAICLYSFSSRSGPLIPFELLDGFIRPSSKAKLYPLHPGP